MQSDIYITIKNLFSADCKDNEGNYEDYSYWPSIHHSTQMIYLIKDLQRIACIMVMN